MEKEVIQIGSSLAVIIPSPVVQSLKIKKGDHLRVETNKRKILLTPIEKINPFNLRGIVKSMGVTEKDFKEAKKAFTKSFEKKWKNF